MCVAFLSCIDFNEISFTKIDKNALTWKIFEIKFMFFLPRGMSLLFNDDDRLVDVLCRQRLKLWNKYSP